MDKMREDQAVSIMDTTQGALERNVISDLEKTSKTGLKFVDKLSFGAQRAAAFVNHVIKGTKKDSCDVTDSAAGDAGKNTEAQVLDGQCCNATARRKRRNRTRQTRKYLPRLEGELSQPVNKFVSDDIGNILPNFCHLSDIHADTVMRQIYDKLPLADLPVPHIISGEKLSYTLDKVGAFDLLGSGSYGAVYKGRYQGQDVAIKLFQRRHSKFVEILEEASKAVHLNDTEVTAHCFGLAIINRSSLYHTVAIVSEFIGGDGNVPITLLDFTNRHIMDPKDPILNGMTKKAWFKLYLEVCEAVQKCHNAEIIIADIKQDNVLLVQKKGVWHPVLIDFGNAQYKSNKPRQDLTKLSAEIRQRLLEQYRHVAPEYINDGFAAEGADVFSLGAMLQDAVNDVIHTAKLKKVIAHCKNADHSLRSMEYIIRKIKKIVKAEKK